MVALVSSRSWLGECHDEMPRYPALLASCPPLPTVPFILSSNPSLPSLWVVPLKIFTNWKQLKASPKQQNTYHISVETLCCLQRWSPLVRERNQGMWSTEIGCRPTVSPPIVLPMLNVCHIFWALILGQISWILAFNSVSDFSCRSACGQIAVTIWEMSPLLSLPCLTAPHPPQEITPPGHRLSFPLPSRQNLFSVRIYFLKVSPNAI